MQTQVEMVTAAQSAKMLERIIENPLITLLHHPTATCGGEQWRARESAPKGDGFLRGKLSTFLGILQSFHSISGRRFFVSLKYKADKSPNQENASGHHQPMWIAEGRQHPSFPLRLQPEFDQPADGFRKRWRVRLIFGPPDN
jgi:hypothetical protein